MEMVLQNRVSLLEMVRDFFQTKKKRNFLFEEGLIPSGESLKYSLDKIWDETRNIKSDSQLIIFDLYFTNVPCENVGEMAGIFFEWLNIHGIKSVTIYTKIRKNCFENVLEKSNIKVLKMPDKIHDRFWIFVHDGEFSIVVVGASFNGFGKNLCFTNKLSPEDTEELLKFLHNTIKE